MKINEVKLGVILSYITIFLNAVIGIVYMPFLTKMLGQSEYGLYSLVANIISYLTILDLGFGNAITIYTAKYIAKNDKQGERKLHGMFLIIYTIIGIIAGIIGTILYFNVNKIFGSTMDLKEINTAKILMKILIFNLIITFPFSIFSSIITAYEKFVFSKIINIIRIVLMPLIMIPLLIMGYKSIALVILTTILNIGCLLINMIYCLTKLHIKFNFKKFDFKLLIEILSYSIFIFLNTIIDKINWSLDTFILGAVSGTISVAIYSVAAHMNTLYLSFSTAISGVLLPRFSKMEAQKANNKQFSEVFIKTGRIQYIVMSLIITGFVLFGKQFIQILFGIEYTSAYYIGCILMIPVTIPLIQNTALSILQAKAKYKFMTIMYICTSIINVAISIPLAKIYQGIGAACGTALSLIVGQIIIMNIYYYKNVKIDIFTFWKEIIKMTIPLIVPILLGLILNKLITLTGIVSLLLKIIIYSVVFIIICWKYSMNNYERELFSKPIK